MNDLVTLFNPNDPTPTAMAICSHQPLKEELHAVHVLLIGKDGYTPEQNESLDRFRKWTSGSIRPNDWPNHMWLSELDWRPLRDSGYEIIYHEVDEISDFDASVLNQGAIVDLFPGSKEHSLEMMVQLQQNEVLSDSLIFKITQIDGNAIDISTGDVIAATKTLTIAERVWLTAGKIARLGVKGKPSVGEKIKNWPHTTNGKKTVPRNREKLAEILHLDEKKTGFVGGYWLEHYASHVIALWPDVVETWHQLHIIPSDWKSFPGVALSKSDSSSKVDMEFIGYPYQFGHTEWPYGYDESGKRNRVEDGQQYINWRTSDQILFFEETELREDQVRHVWDYAFLMDIDVVALLKNGFFVLIECKNTKKTESRHYERINAISAVVAPRSHIPVLIQSTKKTNLDEEQGIFHIHWPDMNKPLIGIGESNSRTIAFFHQQSPVEKLVPKDAEDVKRILSVLQDLDTSFQKNQHMNGISWATARTIIKQMFSDERLKELFKTPKLKFRHLKPYLSDFSLEHASIKFPQAETFQKTVHMNDSEE